MAFSGFSSIHKISRKSNLMISTLEQYPQYARWHFSFKKANKGLYAIRIIKKACVPKSDIVKVYISLIRSILEYLVPAWENIPFYLEDAIESVQKRALAVIFHAGVPSYEEALRSAGVTTLIAHRDHICKRFIQKMKTSGIPFYSITKYNSLLRVHTPFRTDKIWQGFS